MARASLSRSERIRLVEAVRETLYATKAEQADLVLKTFDLEGLDLNSGWGNYDPRTDIRDQVTSATDEMLLDIAAHLELDGFEDEGRRASSAADDLWMPGHLKLFISHMAEHKAFASEVVEELRRIRIDGFVAHTSIEPEREWQVEIERALRSCDALVGLLHPGFKDSTWTQQEVGWALGREVPTVMVSLGEIPAGFKAKHQALMASGSSAAATANQIVVTLSSSRELGAAVADRVLSSLQNARSYYDARDAAQRLAEMGSLSPKILDGICQAYLDNNQIHPHHIAVPVIQQILSKHDREFPALPSP